MMKARATSVIAIVAVLLGVSAVGVAGQSEAEAEPTMEVAADGAAPSPAVDVSLESPAVEGILWESQGLRTADEIEAEAGEETMSEWDALLERTGATYAQISQLNALATDPETGATIGSLSAIRVAGVEESLLEQTFLELLGEATNAEDLLFEEAQLGGKAVTIMIDSPENQGVLVVAGDTAYAIELPPEWIAAVVEALP